MSHLPLALILLAFGLSLLILTIFLKSGASRYLAMDEPNQRSLHSVAVPRVGGIAIVAAALITWSQLPQVSQLLVLLTATLAGVSYIDDRKGLSVTLRLTLHAAAAWIIVASEFSAIGGWMTAGMIVGVIWLTNAYNFMDGADGLAGGMSVFGFSSYGIASSIAHADLLAAMSFILAAATGAFLCFNFPPAKVFMGDAGSISLGFLAAALGLSGWELQVWPLWFPLLVFSPFLVDASVTLLQRVLRRERIWQAHRDHYYQRLIRMGWSHRRTAVAEYLVMAGVAASAVAGLRIQAEQQMLMLAGWAVAYAGMMLSIDIHWRRFVLSGESAPVKLRTLLVILHDLAASALAWALGYWLRFNFDIPPTYANSLLSTLAWVVALQGAIAWGLGLYRGIWRFASLPDLKRIISAVAAGAVTVPMLLHMIQRLSDVPRSVLVLYPILLVLFMGGSRFLYRSWKDGHLLSFRDVTGEPVLVLGAGEAASSLLRELARSRQWHVVGLLDDDPDKRMRLLHGVPVLGPISEIAQVASRHAVHHAIMAMPSATHSHRRQAAKLATEAGLNLLTVPSFEDLLSGRIAISQMRRVELEDLLGRDRVQLDEQGLLALLGGKVVLVTGAGGSIGSELCRQISHYSPRLLVFFEISEFAMYCIEEEFTRQFPELRTACAVGDVRDEARLQEIFGEYRPDVVLHAAAYKHVPLMENDNAWQALRNNVLGTWCVAHAAMAHGVGRFVLISTDKAVNPTNVMGASKRLAEMVCQVLSENAAGQESPTRFVMVRFGNVLGSSGSVIPKFREQIAHGGPLTVTHPDIVRYFMLIPEAAQLVLQAGAMGQGGEIFVLDMGEPIRIVDLARDMIRLSGFSEEDIHIAFTGLRPGEKLYEELLADDEATMPTPHPKLRVARAKNCCDQRWLAELLSWLALPSLDESAVKVGLAARVPEYRPAAPVA